jgi:hypothetical protein
MNAYWRHSLYRGTKRILLPELKYSANNLNQLTAKITEKGGNSLIIGRPWKINELRVKSTEDLNKLWYVLLKERLALKSDYYHSSQINGPNSLKARRCIAKVMTSMMRVKSVIRERNCMKNEFLRFLEFFYIKKSQFKEMHPKWTEKYPYWEDPIVEEIKEVPVQTEPLPEETVKKNTKKQKTKQKKKPQQEENISAKKLVIRGYIPGEVELVSEEIDDKLKEDDNDVKAPTIDEEPVHLKKEEGQEKTKEKKEENKNINRKYSVSVVLKKEKNLINDLKKDMTKKQILNKYISNPEGLQRDEKRRLFAKIQKERAMAGKEIFTREMAAVAYKLKNQTKSKTVNPQIRKLENLK